MYKKIVLLLFFMWSGVCGIENDTISSRSTTPAEELRDSDFENWESCPPKEPCIRKRIHKCTTNPSVSCGQEIWKEELHECYLCDSIWIADSTEWSECEGAGCGDAVQTFTDRCANVAVNGNCKRVKTRFCEPSRTCNGTWSSWSSKEESCQDTCETSRKRMISRDCLKNGKVSSNCDSSRKQFTENNLETCVAKPCTTTITKAIVTTPLPETTEKEITTESILVTEWSEWSVCNASCEQSLGKQQRSRKCTYQTSTDSPLKERCSQFQLLETRNCTVEDEIKCTSPQPKSSTSSGDSQQTTDDLAQKARIFAIEKQPTPTRATYQLSTAPQTSSDKTVEAGLTKEQYQILLIALGSAAFLFIIIITIYFICGKRNKKKRKRRRRKLGEISVVALESHMGFMEGMEKYGFKKSMMPNDALLMSAHGPTASRQDSSNLQSVQENQNAQHIYEDVRLLESEIHQPRFSDISLMRRSVSQRERRQDFYNDEIMRRRTCFIDTEYATPLKMAPKKPPRRSMPQLDIPHKYDRSEMTGMSYNQKSAPLDFIQNIHPPSTTPPITPQPQLKSSLSANDQDTAPPSKSAPASPENYQLGTLYTTQIPFINCMSSPLLVPYSNIPVMRTMQRQSVDIIYMPSLMPIQQATFMTDVSNGNVPQITPLHGTNIRTSEQNLHPASKPRPHSTGVLPVVSITDTNLHQSSRQALESKNPDSTLKQPDHRSIMSQGRSFKNLHGTQNGEASTSQRKQEEEETQSTDVKAEIAEDFEGYVLAMKEV